MTRNPLVWMAVLASAAYLGLTLIDDAEIEAYVRPPVVLMIAVTYTVAVVQMLRTSWSLWTTLGAGLVATIAADALLYYYLFWPWDADAVDGEWRRVILSLLVAGAPFVMFGVIREWRLDNDVSREAIAGPPKEGTGPWT